MAIDYDSGSGLFDKVGVVVSLTNALETFETSTSSGNLEKEMQDLEAKLDDTKQFDRIARDLMYQKWSGYKSALDQMKVQLTELTRLFMASEICTQEGFPDEDLTSLAHCLARAMNRDAETINATDATIAVTPTSTFEDVAMLVCDDAIAHPNPDGDAAGNQWKLTKVFPDVLTARAVDVSQLYAERLSLSGTVARPVSSPDWARFGDLGQITVFRFQDPRNLIVDPGFQALSVSGVPTRWDNYLGAQGTEWVAGPHSNSFDGPNALEFVDVAGFLQRIPRTKLKPFTAYFVAISGYRKNSGDGTVVITVGDYLTQAQDITLGGFAVSNIASWFMYTDAYVEDLVVTIERESATTGEFVLSNVGIFEVPLIPGLGHLACIHYPDPNNNYKMSPIVLNDYATILPSVSAYGTFAKYFGRFVGVELPTVAGGVETISDTLAA